MEEIRIKISDDGGKGLDPTINKLKEVGEIDAKNAAQFEKNQAEFVRANRRRQELIEQEIALQEDLLSRRKLATDPDSIRAYNDDIKKSVDNVKVLKGQTDILAASSTKGLNSMIGGVKGLYSMLRQAAFILPGIGISGLILAGYELLSQAVKDLDLDFMNVNSHVLENVESQKHLNEEQKKTIELLIEEEKNQLRLKRLKGEISEADEKMGVNEIDKKEKIRKLTEDYAKILSDEAIKRKLDLSAMKNGRLPETPLEDIRLLNKSPKEIEDIKSFNNAVEKENEQFNTNLRLITKNSVDEQEAIKLEADNKAKEKADKAAKEALRKQHEENMRIFEEAKKKHEEVKKIEAEGIKAEEEQRLNEINVQKELSDEEIDAANATAEAIDAIRKKNAEDAKQHLEDQISALKIFTSNTSSVLKEAINIQIETIDHKEKLIEQSIDVQKGLAERGLKNDLAGELKRQSELEAQREKDKKKLVKAKELETLVNSIAAFSKDDPKTAIVKALGQLALMKGAEALYMEKGGLIGESNSTSLVNFRGFSRVHPGGGDVLVHAQKGEGVLSRRDIANIGGGKAFMHFKKSLSMNERPFTSASTIISSMNTKGVEDRLDNVERAIKNKKETNFDFDKFGNLIVRTSENGNSNEIKYVLKRTII